MRERFRALKQIDWILLVIPILLTSVGLVMIYSLGLAQGSMSLFWSQVAYAAIAIVVFYIVSSFDYQLFKQASPALYVITVLLLIAVLFIGRTTLGATRWINLGSFQLQPAELMKAILILIVARLLGDSVGNISWSRFFIVLVAAAIPIVLTLLQPDLGTAVVLAAIVGSMVLASRLNVRQLGASAFIIVAVLGLGWVTLKDYQRARIEVFLNHSSDAQGSSYNVRQSIIAVGNGGLTGEGIGRGSQSQLNFLPVAHTDFMFATLAEATGLVGSLTVLLLYAFLIWRIWRLSELLNDSFAMLVAVGVGTMICVQVVVNVGMNIGLLPVTGIPLPFVSHGGSSLIVAVFVVALLESMYRRQRRAGFSLSS